jgi:cupin fold WbuC family metalloprotein
MNSINIISRQLLDEVSGAAKASARQRKNFNFHQRDDDTCHRLLNALEPDTYIPPHCHCDPSKGESIISLRGKIGVLIFSNDGTVSQRLVLQPEDETLGVDIPPGIVHSLVALETNSVFFESKAGPYTPLTEQERCTWAPIENAKEASDYLAWMKREFL